MSNNNTTTTALNAVSELLQIVAEDRAESAGCTMNFKDTPEGKMHLLLDVLLTDSWEMAVRKIALATSAARPDIQFTRDHMLRFKQDSWDVNRRRCGHFVRRLHRDESGMDLFWLMLAAAPGKPWTYTGWLPRLTDALNTMADQITPIEEGLLWHATNRYQRWVDIAAGFPAVTDDPFKAVTEKEIGRAEARRVERDRLDREAAAVAAEASHRAFKSIRELVTPKEYDVQDAADEDSAGVTVIATEAKLTMPYKALVGCQTPLAMTPNLKAIRDELRAEFPHALTAIDLALGDLRPGEPLAFRPFLLVGDSGCGKSRLIRRLGELLNVKVRRYDAAGSSDNSFGGTPKRWTSATPCFPLQSVADTKTANPILMIDEIDKCGTGTAGSLAQALMPFLERETAAAYPDPCFEVECELSYCNYALTANDDSKLPSPLRDRLRIIRVPSPGAEHIESLTASILQDLAVEMNMPAAFLTPLAPDELAVVSRMWGENGSVRKLQKIVRGTVTARDQHASRH
jgi:ATP-dependent Lon protease